MTNGVTNEYDAESDSLIDAIDETENSNFGVHDHAGDLNETEYRILTILAAGSDSGVGVKGQLEQAYGHEISHGSTYPRLDHLRDLGLVTVEPENRRKNTYSITDDGLAVVKSEFFWMAEHLGVSYE